MDLGLDEQQEMLKVGRLRQRFLSVYLSNEAPSRTI